MHEVGTIAAVPRLALEGKLITVSEQLPEWLLKEIAPHADEVRHGRTLLDLAASFLTPLAIDRLSRVAFVVLRPDAMEGGAAIELLDLLEQELGASVLGLAARRVPLPGFHALYRHELHYFGHQVWLNHSLFMSGPTGLAIVEGEPAGHSTFSQRLNAAKGNSNPLAHEDDALRSRLGRVSTIHMGLHVADDVGAFLCQSTLFFTGPDLRNALERQQAISSHVWRPLLTLDPGPRATVFQATLQLKRRILASIRMLRETDDPLIDQLWQMTTDAIVNLRDVSYLRQRDSYQDFARQEHDVLSKLIARAEVESVVQFRDALKGAGKAEPREARLAQAARIQDRLGALYASWYLSGHDATSVDAGEPLLDAIERSNVPLLARARLLAMTALQYDVNPRAHYDGHRLFHNDWS